MAQDLSDPQDEPSIWVDPYSPTAYQIDLFFGDTRLSQGTAFFWKDEDAHVFLVTNWHNVTGVNPITGEHISAYAGEPNRVWFDAYPDGDLNARGRIGRALYDADGNPAWLEHPVFGRNVDVVCLKLQETHKDWVFPINYCEESPLKTLISNDVFVLGFPGGIGADRYPIWKRGSIASEPDIDVGGFPLMYVDTASSAGMSGAPVIQRSPHGGLMEDGIFQLSGKHTRFLGVYSGRLLPEGELRAQLGHVWKARVVGEIIRGNVRGSVR